MALGVPPERDTTVSACPHTVARSSRRSRSLTMCFRPQNREGLTYQFPAGWEEE